MICLILLIVGVRRSYLVARAGAGEHRHDDSVEECDTEDCSDEPCNGGDYRKPCPLIISVCFTVRYDTEDEGTYSEYRPEEAGHDSEGGQDQRYDG